MIRIAYSSLCAAIFLAVPVLGQVGVSFPDTATQRGFLPGGSYQFSQLESIDKASGNLSYHIPITSMPLGRAGFSLPVTLNYNSTQYDYSYYGTHNTLNRSPYPTFIGKSLVASPWSDGSFWGFTLGYNYWLYSESNVINNVAGSGGCSLTQGVTRTSLVTPDGSRHVLYFYGFPQGFTGQGDGFYPWTYSGGSVCTNLAYSNLAMPQTMFTNDGSYIRVTTNSDGSWTAHLKDGTSISSGAAFGGETITDRNGNKITITNVVTQAGQAQTVIQDDLNRTITIQPGLGSTTPTTITQTGFGSSPLNWSFGAAVANASFPLITGTYHCVDGQQQDGQPMPAQDCPFNDFAWPPMTLQVPGSSGPRTYTFTYGANTGLLTGVQLPTGASISYSYQNNNYTTTELLDNLLNNVVSKTVTWTDMADGIATPRVETWNYVVPGYTGGIGSFSVTAPDGGTETTYLGGVSPLTVKTVKPSGDTDDYYYQCNFPWSAGTSPTICANPFVVAEVHSMASSGQPGVSATTFYQVDRNGNQTSATSYDWAAYSNTNRGTYGVFTSLPPTPSSALLRSVQSIYSVQTAAAVTTQSAEVDDSQAYWNPAAATYRNLLRRSVTSDGGGIAAAAMELAYDGSANPQQQRQWDSTKAGLPTGLDSLNASNASVTTYGYDGYGNLTQIMDPKGNVTTGTYDSNNLYLQKEVQGSGTSVARTFTFGWDFNSGRMISKTDVDNSVTTNYGYDPQGRQTNVTEAVGTAAQRQTNSTYDDPNSRVIVSRDQAGNDDGLLVNVTNYDQLGRVALTQELENATTQSATDTTAGIKVLTRYVYNGSNSYKLVSNPFRAAYSSAASAESTIGWTLTQADQDSRPVASTLYSGSGQPVPFGNNPTSFGTVFTVYGTPTANQTKVTDQAGKVRITGTDGLGRLHSVIEDATSGGLNYNTSYTYDALDDLTSVTQSGQNRSFVYDSLKRLSASTNPENYTPLSAPVLGCAGGVYANCYYYDSNGNLTQKTDNRRVGIKYAYDPLNRVKSKTYFNLPLTVNYQSVGYTYDDPNVPLSKGRLTAVYTLPGTYRLASDTSITNFSAYDALGRVTSSSQTTGGNTYLFSNYSYNLAGGLTSETYPSGRVIQTCYDVANRVLQVGGTSCSSATGAYASNFQYAVHGEPIQYAMGNGVWHEPSYDARLEMTNLNEVNNNTGTQLLNAAWIYSPSNNNGNLQCATYVIGGLAFNDTFTYDGVNRLQAANDYIGGTSCPTSGTAGWSRSFSYDAFGNMTPSGNPATPTVSFNSNNQIATQSYDQAGNQLTVNGNILSYDYDNMVATETDGVSQGVETYVYDGNGKRVEKYGPGGVPMTVFVYDALGQLAAEYSTLANSSPCATCYLSPDYLGTPRLVTDQNGNVVARHDYLPFGEELQASTFGRNAQWGTGNDLINQKFTAKERDSESGLDYFGARYYGSALGRFTSPDPSALVFANPLDPQSLNLYAYVRNTPTVSVDPNGEFCYSVNHKDNTVTVDNQSTTTSETCTNGGGTWIDGTATSSWYGSDGVLQIGYSNGSQAGTLSFPSPDVSTDGSGQLHNPWMIDLTDNAKHGPGGDGINAFLFNKVDLYQPRILNMHWCGPGGGGPPTSPNDAACRQHDLDYARAGASAAMNTGALNPTPAQIQAMKVANQKMYDAVKANPPEPSTPFLLFWLGGYIPRTVAAGTAVPNGVNDGIPNWAK